MSFSLFPKNGKSRWNNWRQSNLQSKLDREETLYEINQTKNLSEASKEGISHVTNTEAGIVAEAQFDDYFNKKMALMRSNESFAKNQSKTPEEFFSYAKEKVDEKGKTILKDYAKDNAKKLTKNIFLGVGALAIVVIGFIAFKRLK